MAIFGSLATVRAQWGGGAVPVSVLRYLDELGQEGSATAQRARSVGAGETRRIELGEGAFALEQAYASKARAEGFFESHLKYVDIQIVLEGEEWIEVIDRTETTIAREEPDRDLIVYRDHAGASRLRIKAGQAAVLLPVDVHMPGLRIGTEPMLVRKSVVKVPVAAA